MWAYSLYNWPRLLCCMSTICTGWLVILLKAEGVSLYYHFNCHLIRRVTTDRRCVNCTSRLTFADNDIYPRRWQSRFLPVFVCVSVCLFIGTISQNPMHHARSPNLTYNCSTKSSGNPFILRSKVQRSRSRVTKTVPAWIFALLWLLAYSLVVLR